MEKFVPINKWEGLYEISNRGRLKRLRREIFHKEGNVKPHIYQESIGIGFKEVNGYRCARLLDSKSGRKQDCKIHRLVAEAFIPNPNSLPDVNHIDGNKENNCVENLEWITKADNIKHASRIGLLKGALDARGSKNSQAKLNECDIPIIKQMAYDGFKHWEIALRFKISRTMITNIY